MSTVEDMSRLLSTNSNTDITWGQEGLHCQAAGPHPV